MSSWEIDDDHRMNFQIDDVDDQGEFDHYHHHHHNQDSSHAHGLSRLATCTTSNSTLDCENFEPEEHSGNLKTMLSHLSIESIDFGGDADEELSEDAGHEEKNCLSSDYDNEKMSVSVPVAWYSLPQTPLQHQRHQGLFGNMKQYASENETSKLSKSDRRRRWKRRVLKRENMKVDDEENSVGWRSHGNNSFSGESENGGGLRVITRPKGGEHSLSMDMEEVKACRDLGFELELDTKLMPSRLTISAPLLDTGNATTSSGGSSPISNWRISSPGDDPKDVKSRLKVWAQAVALASTSPRSGGSC